MPSSCGHPEVLWQVHSWAHTGVLFWQVNLYTFQGTVLTSKLNCFFFSLSKILFGHNIFFPFIYFSGDILNPFWNSKDWNMNVHQEYISRTWKGFNDILDCYRWDWSLLLPYCSNLIIKALEKVHWMHIPIRRNILKMHYEF